MNLAEAAQWMGVSEEDLRRAMVEHEFPLHAGPGGLGTTEDEIAIWAGRQIFRRGQVDG